MTTHSKLIETLTASPVYREYERAFSEATGMPLALRPLECWQLPHHGKRKENPFCALMATRSSACAACLQTQQQLADSARAGAQTITCAHGLCETAVPVRVGHEVIGFLQTGEVFRRKPTRGQFERAAKLIRGWGIEVEPAQLRKLYFDSPVVPARQYDSTIDLLKTFAEHLSLVANQILVQQQNAEPPVITRAREFIRQHQSEDLSLGQVARAVNTSTFYFCKLFKKVTGLNFTDYVARLRIERAKSLLLNPNLRVSEIAYEVGFQSLTHFNRVFKKILGQSPTEYRSHLPAAG
jgi:AraC-like DNA-binding protein